MGLVFLPPPPPYLVDGQPADRAHSTPLPLGVLSRSANCLSSSVWRRQAVSQRSVRTTTSTPWAPIYHLVRRTEKGKFIFWPTWAMCLICKSAFGCPVPAPWSAGICLRAPSTACRHTFPTVTASQ